MTARLLDANGVRLCPLGCGPNAPMGKDGTRQHACAMATSKQGKPGERVFTAALPGVCRMFYDAKGEPT